ncbi:MAG: 3,4-dihydroxy-2-butanone-4-phosphate synthase [Coxiellaceae bacterium]|nr:3,4-dihydroxy-2-butanone-4-phosphate synthase [Coxiellaceae bacterium]|tara:strand:- start:14298 stop:15515 length:1218 start_codon:yes stop_codon:yes gene_type:complete
MRHEESYFRIEAAISALQKGGLILLVDDESRENEGDFVASGALMNEDALHTMVSHGSGIVCLAMTQSDSQRLGIPPMVATNASAQKTPFGVSFEAASGITTGVSIQDRLCSIRVASLTTGQRQDIVMPGHIFPLIAQDKGVFVRGGHTEGSVDLMKLAGISTCAVICEVMSADGTMARYPELKALAQKLQIPIISIQDIERYRTRNESWVEPTKTVALPSHVADNLLITIFKDTMHDVEYSVIHRRWQNNAPLVRIHSQCFTGDVLGSLRCDCGSQLTLALQMISQQGGAIIYAPQEGRGIGLAHKIEAYALQDNGLDTVEANQHLGLAVDSRDYGVCAQILRHLGIDRVRLLTNNPLKVTGLEDYGVLVEETVPIQVKTNPFNDNYIKTKRDKLNHRFKSGVTS